MVVEYCRWVSRCHSTVDNLGRHFVTRTLTSGTSRDTGSSFLQVVCRSSDGGPDFLYCMSQGSWTLDGSIPDDDDDRWDTG